MTRHDEGGSRIPVRTLLHSDWSVSPPGRWVAQADRAEAGWHVAAPRPVGDCAAFVDSLWLLPGPVLAGFDFPIGLPEAYGRTTGLKGFPAALEAFGHGEWADIFRVAETAAEISPRRPFYPHASSAAARQHHLLEALGVTHMDGLRRRCERATPTRRAANPLFWTLGGSQVGKAAIAGWQQVIVPARRRGALLWPFEGSLSELAASAAPVLAETYPAEAYAHVGVRFSPGMSKRRQDDRRAATRDLAGWADRHGVVFAPDLLARLDDGFGGARNGEDAFDALIGLLGMIEVVEGRRPEHPAARDREEAWEGWILGQADGPRAAG